jgi:hypothetical protein
MSALRHIALGATLAVCCQAAPAWSGPDEEPPPRSLQFEWVGQDMRVNGVPSRVSRFVTELTPDEVLAHYRRRWQRWGEALMRPAAANGWQGLTQLRRPYQVAVQVRRQADGATEGLISITDLENAQADFVPKAWPRWADTRVLQVTESTDGPLHSQLVTMLSDASFEVLRTRWRDEWQRRGFVLTNEVQPAAQPGQRSWHASFDRASDSLDVSVTWVESARRAQIAANLVSRERRP